MVLFTINILTKQLDSAYGHKTIHKNFIIIRKKGKIKNICLF